MRGAIMQPTFLPWLGYFAMIDSVDLFVFLDHVQIVKRSWQVRNRIKFGNEEKMLTIPVVNTERDNMKLNNTNMVKDGWRDRHLDTLYHAYHKSRCFTDVFPIIEQVYNKELNVIADFTIEMITEICKYLNVSTRCIRSSDLGDFETRKDELLVEICRRCGIEEYLSAYGSSAYIEKTVIGGAFSNSGIKLVYQNYEHPVYEQMGKDFLPYMGVIDLLFNHGDKSIGIIRKGVGKVFTSMDILEQEKILGGGIE